MLTDIIYGVGLYKLACKGDAWFVDSVYVLGRPYSSVRVRDDALLDLSPLGVRVCKQCTYM